MKRVQYIIFQKNSNRRFRIAVPAADIENGGTVSICAAVLNFLVVSIYEIQATFFLKITRTDPRISAAAAI